MVVQVCEVHCWGLDLAAAEHEGYLELVCSYLKSRGLEDHLIQIKRGIKEFGPIRIAVDSLSALEWGATLKSSREFVIGMTIQEALPVRPGHSLRQPGDLTRQ